MGGVLTLTVEGKVEAADADRRLRQVGSRVHRWADRLTRFDPASELCALNATPGTDPVAVGPTLAAVLERASRLVDRTEGLFDATLLDERLRAEHRGVAPAGSGHGDRGGTRRDWLLRDSGRGTRQVERCPGVRFDLDGVAKGWIADRARALLTDMPSAVVDADGDIALHVAPGTDWEVAVADPASDTAELARLRVGDRRSTRVLGVATSGTTVHRWDGPSGLAHHLIDPRTGRPAVTDVIQATVVAEDATTAEGLAKAAVIAGAETAAGLLERAGAWAAVLLLSDGDVIASPSTIAWLVS
jgi:thiamine biosynthesis lipoprotein